MRAGREGKQLGRHKSGRGSKGRAAECRGADVVESRRAFAAILEPRAAPCIAAAPRAPRDPEKQQASHCARMLADVRCVIQKANF